VNKLNCFHHFKKEVLKLMKVKKTKNKINKWKEDVKHRVFKKGQAKY
jgi:hypothetical protein